MRMSETVERDYLEDTETEHEPDEFGLDDDIAQEAGLIQEEKDKSAKYTPEQIENARVWASRINSGFVVAVDKFVCPSVELAEMVDVSQGVEALTPVVLELGGGDSAWLKKMESKYTPYIAAGMYLGTTIVIARGAEKAARAQQESGGENGKE